MYFICSGDCAHFDAGAFNLDTVCTFSGASMRLTGAERAHANTHTHTQFAFQCTDHTAMTYLNIFPRNVQSIKKLIIGHNAEGIAVTARNNNKNSKFINILRDFIFIGLFSVS